MSTRTKTPEMIAARRDMHRACAVDMQKFCANVPRGCGGPKKCLKSHAAGLSQPCAAAWKKLKAVRHSRG
jgi:hypothetical protein